MGSSVGRGSSLSRVEFSKSRAAVSFLRESLSSHLSMCETVTHLEVALGKVFERDLFEILSSHGKITTRFFFSVVNHGSLERKCEASSKNLDPG